MIFTDILSTSGDIDGLTIRRIAKILFGSVEFYYACWLDSNKKSAPRHMRNDCEISLRIISIHWVVLTMRKIDKI